MKFSNIFLAASFLLLDTGFVQGQKKPGTGNNSMPGEEIENQCTADAIDTLLVVGKKECMKTKGCAIVDNVCVDFELIACDEITEPTKKNCKKKNGCVFDKKAGTCEVKRKGKIENECTADAIDTVTEVGKKVCMKTMGCVVEDNKCVDVTPCDQITTPDKKKKCKNNGCVFNKGTCEVSPLDLCIAKCTDDENNCCLKECYCSNYDKGGKCNKDNNCAVNKDTKVCALKSAGEIFDFNCSKFGNKRNCTSKKNVKKGCVYKDGSCSQTGCAIHNGQATECDNAGCAYNGCTDECSKKKE